MNFLAHAFLAYPSEDLQVGAFLGDFIRGKHFEAKFSAQIAEGIRLHRQIDSFTDQHPDVHACNHLLYPTQGKYAPVLSDMLFDHLLVKHWTAFSDITLHAFSTNFYRILKQHEELFPKPAQRTWYYMHQYDWLSSYGTAAGMKRVLGGLSRRVRFKNQLDRGWEDFLQHRDELNTYFLRFMPEVIAFVEKEKHPKGGTT